VVSVALAGFQLYLRLASGDWPYTGDRFGDDSGTGLLAVGCFYAVLGGRQLVRRRGS
jgi:hypothetical protein